MGRIVDKWVLVGVYVRVDCGGATAKDLGWVRMADGISRGFCKRHRGCAALCFESRLATPNRRSMYRCNKMRYLAVRSRRTAQLSFNSDIRPHQNIIMKLYRYRPVNANTFSEIAEEKAWYSKYVELNDPFEGRYINKSNEVAFDHLIQQFRACCFSKSHDNLLLWAHYAENHWGICLEYEIPDEVYRTQFLPVKYSKSQPVLQKVERYPEGDINAGALSLGINGDAAVFLTKSEDWAYEQEWRMLRIAEQPLEKGEKHAIPGKLSAVYFGLRTDEATKKIIYRLVSSESHIQFWQASLQSGHFSLVFTSI